MLGFRPHRVISALQDLAPWLLRNSPQPPARIIQVMPGPRRAPDSILRVRIFRLSFSRVGDIA